MKKIVLVSAIGALSSLGSVAFAQETGRVISSTPVIQQVAVPRQVCNNQPVAVQPPTSGGGAVIGGLAGGAIGNQIGHGSGRAAATMLGLVGGALLGNQIEGNNNAAQVQNVQQCSTQTFYENRTMGYNVQYEYGGKQYNVQMPYDPGPTIRLQVTPMSGNRAEPGYSAQSAPGAGGQGVIVAPPMGQAAVGQPVAQIIGVPSTAAYPVYYSDQPVYQPVYQPGYYRAPYYYPPISLSLGFGFYGGHRHHGHWR